MAETSIAASIAVNFAARCACLFGLFTITSRKMAVGRAEQGAIISQIYLGLRISVDVHLHFR